MCVLCSSEADSVARHAAGGPAFASTSSSGVTATGNQNVDALIYGVRWTPTALTVAFPDPSWYFGGWDPLFFENGYFNALQIEVQSGFQATQPLAQAVADILLNDYGGASNLTFTDPQRGQHADMEIFIGNPIGPGTAVGGIPGFSPGQAGGDVWFDYANQGDFANPVVGNYNWTTVLHELGHALGLKHGHSADYGFTMQAMEADRNSMEFSIMTYAGHIGADTAKGYTVKEGSFATTLMMYDIYALQHLYGANYDKNSGDTTYTFEPNTGAARINGDFWIQSSANKIFLTIWDGGGNDTYDFSNYGTNQVIDLTPGGWSVLSDAQLAELGGGPNNGLARGNVFNALLFEGDTRSLIENAKGGMGSDLIFGNIGRNTLTGNGGNDVLNGDQGIDTLIGGAGNDTLVIDSADDVVVEDANGGTDSIWTSVSYTLADDVFVENLETADDDGTTAIALTGNKLNNAIKGNAGRNTLVGGLGDDTLDGLGGIDVADYRGTAAVVVNLALTGAQNTKSAGVDTLLNIEDLIGGNGNDTLTGSAANNRLNGGRGADRLNGGAGSDTLTGGLGNDLYYVDRSTDVIVEKAGDGTDRALASASYALKAGVSVETLATTNIRATKAIDLTGNEFANKIQGNAGRNTLDGKGGADTLEGGGGNDTYRVDSAKDVIIEAAGGGTDKVMTSVNYTLAAGVHVETLTTISAGATTTIKLTGNTLANRLVGNAGANDLNGGGGADTLEGGGGNDTYRVDSSNDVIVEAAGKGNDKVIASASYTLKAGVSVETMTTVSAAAKTAINLTGNEFDNRIYGNAGANILDGGLGNDRLDGGDGIDTALYTVARAVKVSLATTSAQNTGGAGRDTLVDIENLTTGNGADRLTGSTGKNVLNGGGGNDTLLGGGGADTLIGGSGNDILIGGAGKDSLTGGTGKDRFDFDSVADIGKGGTRDVIADFSLREDDRIDLATIDASTKAGGNQAFTFIEDDRFSKVAGELRSFSNSSITLVEGDINGDGLADFQIQLTGVLNLTVGDFIL